jgi:quinolinate synthase
MTKYVQKSSAGEFIIGTEVGIIHRLKKENPNKNFYPVSDLAVCPNMKKTTLDKVITALEDLAPEVVVPEKISNRARAAIQKMLDYHD